MNVVLANLASFVPLFADEAPAAAPAGSGPFTAMIGIFLLLIVLFFVIVLPSKSRDKQARKMLDSLKPNDKVLTYGGVIGVVYSIDKQAGEVVLRVDDSANVKMRFALSSIYFVYDKQAAKEAKDAAKEGGKDKKN